MINTAEDFLSIDSTADKEQISQIGQRLRGLREVLGISAEEVAEVCGVTVEHYLNIENGKGDPSVYRLMRISRRYGISLDVLLYGEDPRMSSYFVTRRGQGQEIERRNNYKYFSLASGFRGRKIDPFLVVLNPLPNGRKFNKSSHDGQELDIILTGRLELTLDDKAIVLEQGDTIYFDARKPHCMRALGDEQVSFLCIVV